ncbi:MAG: acyl carrier protein [Phycisphaerae bacterium]|nr:acyl carrier protein [Phycisphaerae bacterium]
MSTQTTETVTRQVIEIISNQMNIPKEQISLDSQFTADLEYDSLDLVEFAMLLEEEFDITVPDDQNDKIKSVQDAVQTVQKLIS